MTRDVVLVVGGSALLFFVHTPRGHSQTTVTAPPCAAEVVDLVAFEAFTRLEARHDVHVTFDGSVCRGARVRVQLRDSRGRTRVVFLSRPPGPPRARARALALSLAESSRGLPRAVRRDAPRSRDAAATEADPASAAASAPESSSNSTPETNGTAEPPGPAPESSSEPGPEPAPESSSESTPESSSESNPESIASSSESTHEPSSGSIGSASERVSDPTSGPIESAESATPEPRASAVETLDGASCRSPPCGGRALPSTSPNPRSQKPERTSRRLGLDAFVRSSRGPSVLFGAAIELRWRRRALVLVPHVAASFGGVRRDVRARALLSELGLSVGAVWVRRVEVDLRVGPRLGVLGTWSTARGDATAVPWLHLESELRVAFGSVVLRGALGAIVLGARVHTPNAIAFDLRGLTLGVGVGVRTRR